MKTCMRWRDALKQWSNQIILIAGALPFAWLSLPEDWRAAVVEWNNGVLVLGASVLAAAAFIASNLKQKRLTSLMEKAYAKSIKDETESS